MKIPYHNSFLGATEVTSVNANASDGINVNGKPLDYSGFKPDYDILESYDHLISSAEKSSFLEGSGLGVTLSLIKDTVRKNHCQVSKLAKHLKSDSIKQSSFNIWHFITTNILYAPDTPGHEEIRTPARSWFDRNTGIDCDCMSVFASSLLIEMGYAPVLEIVEFNNKGEYSHIYVVTNNIVIDPVLTTFNMRPPGITKILSMTIPVYSLNGIEKPLLIGLGGIANEIDETTRLLMDEQSELLSGDYSNSEMNKLRTMIMLNGLPERDVLLPIMPYVIDITPEGNFVFPSEEVAEAALNYFKVAEEYLNNENGIGSWLGDKLKQAAKAVGQAAKYVNKKVIQPVVKAVIRFNPLTIAARNGLLVLLHFNVFGVATKLAPAFLTDAQAKSAGYNMTEFAKLKTAYQKSKKLYEKIGGKESVFKKHIEAGAKRKPFMNPKAKDAQALYLDAKSAAPDGSEIGSLGEAVTVATATATSGGFLASIIAWLKNIDWSKLGTKFIENKLDKSSTTTADKSENFGFNTDEEMEQFLKNASASETPGTTSTTNMLIPIGIGVAALLLLMRN